MTSNLIIEFPNDELARNFAEWLCESGEQDYWMYQECQENDTVTFDYHSGPRNEFVPDLVIKTKVR